MNIEKELGKVSMAVSEEKGKVVLSFTEQVGFVVLDAETARGAAESIARAAYSCRYGIPFNHDKKSCIGEEKIMRLITRCTHVIRSMNDKKAMPGKIASACVDEVLKEML